MNPTKAIQNYLPLVVIAVGVFFGLLIFHEYYRNSSLIDENKALIVESAKVRLQNSLLNALPALDANSWDENYSWVKQKPDFYHFESGKQVFPWFHQQEPGDSIINRKWDLVWSEVNGLSSAKYINDDRLSLLVDVKNALATNDAGKISQAFSAYMLHQEAFILSPLEEIAFSLKLIDLGIKEHWNGELIDAFLLTGGPIERPIIRPVVDWLFKYNHLLTRQEIQNIFEKIKVTLVQASLPSYFLDEYIYHFDEPQFLLSESEAELGIENNSWLVQRLDDQVIALQIQLNLELAKIITDFFDLGSLQEGDTLFFLQNTNGDLGDLQLGVNKFQLNRANKVQFVYLIVKLLMLIAFVSLLIAALRMIELNHQRRLEYINLKEDFVKLVGHELKTPLSGIRAMAETLQKRIHKGLDVQSYPDRIVNESDKLWHMVDNVLNYNRMQEDSFQLILEQVSLNNLCHSIMEQVARDSDKKYQFSNTIPDNIFYNLDVQLFGLIIKNIIMNAALYNENQVTSIHFFLENDVLKIKDNAIGIDEKDYQRVFEPFVRLPQSFTCSGTGIGLSLCQKIAQLHGGEITIEQSDETGTLWAISIHND